MYSPVFMQKLIHARTQILQRLVDLYGVGPEIRIKKHARRISLGKKSSKSSINRLARAVSTNASIHIPKESPGSLSPKSTDSPHQRKKTLTKESFSSTISIIDEKKSPNKNNTSSPKDRSREVKSLKSSADYNRFTDQSPKKSDSPKELYPLPIKKADIPSKERLHRRDKTPPKKSHSEASVKFKRTIEVKHGLSVEIPSLSMDKVSTVIPLTLSEPSLVPITTDDNSTVPNIKLSLI